MRSLKDSNVKEIIDRLRDKAKRKIPASDVEDLVQEVLVILVERMQRSQQIDSIQAYTDGILRHVIYDYYQRRREQLQSNEMMCEQESDVPSPEQRVVWMRHLRVVEQLAAENQIDGALVRDHFMNGEPLREVAEQLNVSSGVVNGRLFRFRQKLLQYAGSCFAVLFLCFGWLWRNIAKAADYIRSPKVAVCSGSAILLGLGLWLFQTDKPYWLSSFWSSPSSNTKNHIKINDHPALSDLRDLNESEFATSPTHINSVNIDGWNYLGFGSVQRSPSQASQILSAKLIVYRQPYMGSVVDTDCQFEPCYGNILNTRAGGIFAISDHPSHADDSLQRDGDVKRHRSISIPPTSAQISPHRSEASNQANSTKSSSESRQIPVDLSKDKTHNHSSDDILGDQLLERGKTDGQHVDQKKSDLDSSHHNYPRGVLPSLPNQPTISTDIKGRKTSYPDLIPSSSENQKDPRGAEQPNQARSAPSEDHKPQAGSSNHGGTMIEPQMPDPVPQDHHGEPPARVNQDKDKQHRGIAFCVVQDQRIYRCDSGMMQDITGPFSQVFQCKKSLCHQMIGRGPVLLFTQKGEILIVGSDHYRVSKDGGMTWFTPSQVEDDSILLNYTLLLLHHKGDIWQNIKQEWRHIREQKVEIHEVRLELNHNQVRISDDTGYHFDLLWQSVSSSLPDMQYANPASRFGQNNHHLPFNTSELPTKIDHNTSHNPLPNNNNTPIRNQR